MSATGSVRLSILVLMSALLAQAGNRRLEFDGTSVIIDGRRQFLVSGEFHYFRVPKADWARRLELLKEAGGNCVATYVPWCLHEQKEGEIVFGDRPERDLDGFLKAVEKAGLMAIVRPGPYQYSELMFDGLPRWLVENHPEIHTKKADGTRLRTASVDYNHPVFLEKTRNYFKAVAEVVKPHLAANGGCVTLVQLDNELTGIHVWFGAPQTPAYFEDCADYLVKLRDCLAEFGVTGPYCHNAGGTMMTANYAPCVRKLGTRDFLLGYDSYYNLSDVRRPENPTYDYFMGTLFACDLLRSYGYPPVGFEIQAGTIGDSPPILPNDLLASYMVNLAAGMKGLNYYVFTGGPNPDGLGNTVDVYDYHAPVSADGSLKPTYGALKEFGRFLADHPQLVDAERLSSVRLGHEWRHFAGCAKKDEGFFRYGLRYTLLQSAYQPEHVLLDGRSEIPADKPLALAGIESMSEPVQRKVAAFVKAGGRLLVAPDFPRTDLDGRPCTVLADALGGPAAVADRVDTVAEPLCLSGDMRIYSVSPLFRFGDLGAAEAVLTSADRRRVFGCAWACGRGRVIRVGATWRAYNRHQIAFVERLMEDLGAKPVAKSSEPNVFHSSFRLKDGGTATFVMNLRASPLATTLTLPDGRSRRFDLKPMEVAYAEFAGAHTGQVERMLADGVNGAVSPDGRLLAFQRFVGNRSRIAVRELASGRETWVEDGEHSALHPVWGPDSSLYYSYCATTATAYQKWIRPATDADKGWNIRKWKDGRTTDLTSGGARDFLPAVSPDGRKVYFCTTRGVYNPHTLFSMSQNLASVGTEGGEVETVLRSQHTANSGYAQPDVSPDGRHLVWAQIDSFYDCWRIYASRIETPKRAIALLPPGFVAYAPRWSPDGRLVAFTGFREGDPGWCVYLTDVRSGAWTRICRGDNPSFFPDGGSIVYDRGGKLFRRTLAPSDLPRGGTSASPGCEAEKVVWRADAPKPDAKLPFPGELAFADDETFFVRVKLHWADSGERLQRFFAGAYADTVKRDQAVQIYRDPKGLPSFATRTGADEFTYAQLGEPLTKEGDYTFTGIRACGELFLSQDGGWPARQALSGGMIPLRNPLYALLGRDIGSSATSIKSVEIGTGWPKDVPFALSRKEVFE